MLLPVAKRSSTGRRLSEQSLFLLMDWDWDASSSFASAGVTRIRRCDLQRIGRLGVGAFGLVTLEARHHQYWIVGMCWPVVIQLFQTARTQHPDSTDPAEVQADRRTGRTYVCCSDSCHHILTRCYCGRSLCNSNDCNRSSLRILASCLDTSS